MISESIDYRSSSHWPANSQASKTLFLSFIEISLMIRQHSQLSERKIQIKKKIEK